MRLPGRTARRLGLFFVLVTTLPLVGAILVARSLADSTIALFYNANIVSELERSLGVYSELAAAMKEGLRAKADAIAAQEPLRMAALLRDGPSIEQELTEAFRTYPDIVSIAILAPPGEKRAAPDPAVGEPPGDDEAPPPDDGPVPGAAPATEDDLPVRIGYRDRGRPIDESIERKLTVQRPLDRRPSAPTLEVTFAAPRATLDNIAHASEFLQTYRLMNPDNSLLERWYLRACVAVMGGTIPISMLLGVALARQLTRRIDSLALATERVAEGDLTVQAPVEGADELTELARAFNRMVQEVAESRARIEFLNRMGTWQEMARRLAHEIKNPLTPIQLAVQECHRRYEGDNPRFRKLLDTTLEIVEEEVGTLRRLVTEFSSFARLPRASLLEGDLREYLGEQRDRLALGEVDEETPGALGSVAVTWTLPSHPLPVAFDSMLLHRVLVNVVTNAAQAIQGAGKTSGEVQVNVREEQNFVVIDVDDTGPGIPDELRERIFDPYFTTKSDGNGLGLAIVKKIVVEHGGSIDAMAGSLGGARVRIRLPRMGTPSSLVALAHSGRQSLPPAPASA